MSDPWSRPTDDRPSPDRVVEIELDGTDVEPREPHDPRRTEPNWRLVLAVASLAGVALGVIVATLIFAAQDDPAVDGSSPDRDEAVDGSTLTTPETLPSVEIDTTASADARDASDANDPSDVSDPSDPSDGSVIDRLPGVPLSLPEYPSATLPSDLLAFFVLDADTIAANQADRVTVDVSTADELGATHVTIEYDQVNDRYLATVDQRGPVQRVLVDRDALYVMDRARDSEQWTQIAGQNAAESAVDVYRSLLLSPVRPETLAAAATVPGTGVVLDSGFARRYRVTLPSIAIPEWSSGLDGPAPPGVDHVFEAYVDRGGRLVLVQGTVVIDGVRNLIVYHFDHNAEPTIDLPDPDAATG